MNTHLKQTGAIVGRLSPITLLLICLLTAVAVKAQDQTASTDRDNPTALTSNVIAADGVDEKTEYFYSFAAGPGDVTLTLDVKAQKNTAVSSVDIALYDAKSKKLLSTYANPDHGSSKRAVETAKVRGTQTLLLEVTVSPGVDTFKIKLDGAVQITPPTTTDSAAPSPTPTPAGESDARTAEAVPTAAQDQSAAPSQQAGPTDATTQPAEQASVGNAQAVSGPSGTSMQDSSPTQGGKVAKNDSTTSTLNSLITVATSTTGKVKAAKQSVKPTPKQSDAQQQNAQNEVPQSAPISRRLSSPAPAVRAIDSTITPGVIPRSQPTVVAVASKQPAAHFVGVTSNTLAGRDEPRLAKPQLTIKVQQNQDVVYYSLMISNSFAFDARRFVVARRLPPSPCNPEGKARLLLSYYSADGKSLGCRALSGPQDLSRTSLRFLKKDAPSSVYVTIKDEATREVVRSNVVAVAN